MNPIINQASVSHQLYFFYSVEGGLVQIARQTGLADFREGSQKQLDVRVGRIDEAGERTAINTDAQMELEMPSIRNQVDKLQGVFSYSHLLLLLGLLLYSGLISKLN